MNDLSYPQRMGQVLLKATEEVLGEEGLHCLLKAADLAVTAGDKAVRVPTPSRYLECLEQVYGPQSGRGISRRIGRACLPYGLREFGGSLGVTGSSFRLLPLPAKLTTFAGALAELLHAHTGQRITVEQTDGQLLWHSEGCPLCSQRHTSDPACHLAVGFAEEALYWLSGGKIFLVEEIACIARGDPRCTLRIDEAPIS